MSQVRRHDHDTNPHLSPTSTTTSSPLSSRLPFPPPAGVAQTADPSDLNANLIPRNYLQRSDVVTPRPSVTVDTAAHRRPIPSPLHPAFGSPPPSTHREHYDSPPYNNNHHYHQNYSNYYHGRASPASSTQSPILGRNPFSSPSDRGSPITPVSSSGFPVPPTRLRQASSVASMATTPTEQVEAGISSEKNESAKTTDTPSQDVTEKTSDPATAAQQDSSPPTSPPRQTVPTVAGRPVPRGIPRTSSIDSAISSISSASHSHKSSVDSNALSPADISNLIAAAGSPEAVIAHLLKEKSHAASQNAKLWRLVEKQRTMVLGLNKDLERAMKDKERYRKKVKELQNVPPPLPQQTGKAVEGDAGQSQVASQSSQSQPSAPVAAVKSEPTELSDADLQNPIEKTGMTPSPLHVTHRHVEPSSSSPHDQTSEPSSADNSPTKPGVNGKNPTTPTIDSRQPPSLAVVESSPVMTKSETMSPNVRKAPPAPLNLSRASAHLHHADPQDDSDSDYDDILEVDEIPAVTERGRRKTREEDDREREAAALREQEARSRSSKKAKAVISPEKTKENIRPPTGQRQMVPQSPPAAGFSNLYPPESQSLASVLSPPTSENSSTRERSIPTPLMSPGLPTSPRPGDRPPGSPMPRMPRDAATSPPMSPRNGMPGLPLSPRAPKYPIPLPPNTPMSLASPTAAKTNKSPSSPTHENTEMAIPTINANVDSDSPTSPRDIQKGISRRLVSEGYPDLLLPPNALPSIEIKVSSSRLRPSRNSYMASKPSEEEPVFTLSVFSRSDGSELWRVEKVILALPQLDQQVKQVSGFSAKLPDRSIFSGHSPAKVDARRAALNYYFAAMLDTPMDETAALVVCRFLTSDAIEPRDDETSLLHGPGKARPTILLGPDGKPRKEGYLTKKGKNFGGWKARYFVLHGPEFKYYESPGGPHLGTIKIHHAQIGRQSQSGHSHSPSDNDADDQYRHAFLILEPKRKDSSALVRHVLCAESDEERDAWVEALMQYVENQSSDEEGSHPTTLSKNPTRPSTSSASKSGYGSSSAKKGVRETDSPDSEKDTLRGFSYDDAVQASAPVRGYAYDKNGVPPSPARVGSAAEFYNSMSDQTGSHPPKTISGPTNGAVIQDAGMWGNKPATSGKEKKRSIWGFRARNSSEMMTPTQGYESTTSLAHNNTSVERREPIMPVFGMPLAEAVEYCPPHGVDADLPAVVYRCIEYLTAKGAASEEGIFRLSGSNVVVKALKERFNTEGDVDFLSGDHYYDVHAVASLFKTYLRELPTTVLTRELHLDFLRVLELEGREKKIAAFSGLVHRLPKANLSLLSALSRFLIVITNNSDVNKMTVRNVGIVFAPTLNIPAPVFSTFLTDYDQIFGEELAEAGNKMVEQQLTVEKPVAPDDVRSPRHQMFSDVGAPPSYNDAVYQGMDSPGPGSHQDIRSAYDTGFIPMQQPSYQQQPLGSDPGQRLDPSQINRGLAPGNPNQSKSKRRESSMLFMGMGNRKSSIAKSRDDQSLVAEDSAFE